MPNASRSATKTPQDSAPDTERRPKKPAKPGLRLVPPAPPTPRSGPTPFPKGLTPLTEPDAPPTRKALRAALLQSSTYSHDARLEFQRVLDDPKATDAQKLEAARNFAERVKTANAGAAVILNPARCVEEQQTNARIMEMTALHYRLKSAADLMESSGVPVALAVVDAYASKALREVPVEVVDAMGILTKFMARLQLKSTEAAELNEKLRVEYDRQYEEQGGKRASLVYRVEAYMKEIDEAVNTARLRAIELFSSLPWLASEHNDKLMERFEASDDGAPYRRLHEHETLVALRAVMSQIETASERVTALLRDPDLNLEVLA